MSIQTKLISSLLIAVDQESLLREYYESYPKDPECKNCEQRPYIVKGDEGRRGKPGFPGIRGESVRYYFLYTLVAITFHCLTYCERVLVKNKEL